jgi:hypothetical protein
MPSPARGSPWSSLAILLSTILSLAVTISAQQGTILDKSKLPACALQCANLENSQKLCVPPIAPAQGQAVYQACFCNSNYLVNYKSGTPTGVCDAECPAAADRQQILTWYTGLCTGGVVVIPNNGVATTATTTAAGAAGTSTTSSSSSSSKSSSQPTW